MVRSDDGSEGHNCQGASLRLSPYCVQRTCYPLQARAPQRWVDLKVRRTQVDEKRVPWFYRINPPFMTQCLDNGRSSHGAKQRLRQDPLGPVRGPNPRWRVGQRATRLRPSHMESRWQDDPSGSQLTDGTTKPPAAPNHHLCRLADPGSDPRAGLGHSASALE